MFKNETLNGQYKMEVADTDIQVPGYKGKLSEVPSADILEGLISRGNNIVSRLPEKKNQAAGDNPE